MEELKLYNKCGVCGGDGIIQADVSNPETIDPCPSCGGSGYHEAGKLDGYDYFKDIQDKQADILGKLDDIIEKLSE